MGKQQKIKEKKVVEFQCAVRRRHSKVREIKSKHVNGRKKNSNKKTGERKQFNVAKNERTKQMQINRCLPLFSAGCESGCKETKRKFEKVHQNPDLTIEMSAITYTKKKKRRWQEAERHLTHIQKKIDEIAQCAILFFFTVPVQALSRLDKTV